ncbi:MAG: hypothetical protein WCC22_07820 [Terriglobales bacterium]
MAQLRARSPQIVGRDALQPSFFAAALDHVPDHVLGDRFAPNLSGPRAFHDAVLDQGPLPLDVLEGKIDVWIRERK